jgi:16S rRNA (guanine966-N2)-methyltransferase
VPGAEGLRPTPDRVRETLFNWLAPYIDGARCLDLFAGTGALCFEALSRGAATVVMVERSAQAQRQLRENVGLLGATGAEVVAADALECLHGRPRAFDIVFLDPPFAAAAEMIGNCAARLSQGWLRPGALIYVEAPRAMRTPPVPVDWILKKQGFAGQVHYLLFQPPPAPP